MPTLERSLLIDVSFGSHEWREYATIPVLPDDFSPKIGEWLSLEVVKDEQTVTITIGFLHVLGSKVGFRAYSGYLQEGYPNECKMTVNLQEMSATIETWVDTGFRGPNEWDNPHPFKRY